MIVTEEQMRSIRTRIEQELSEVLREIQEIDQEVRTFAESQDASEGVTNHIGDDADVVYEQERLLTIRGQLNDRRLQMAHALEKIDRGTYGICERCGEPIAPERLEALPFVAYCISCQEIVDRQGEHRR
jgi:DnaK suppressor protein